ncbi:MAG: ABC transporter ATP-binding protein [Solirubrobacteraceae bacterium]
MAAVEVDRLWQAYQPRSSHGTHKHGPPVWALADVTLSIAPGEAVGIVGSNGSGKTTLLRTVAGVLRPSRGQVVTRGRVSSLVDPEAGVPRDLTGRENLLLAGVLLGMRRAEVASRREEIAEFAGLSQSVLDSPLQTYSAGMALRLGFALVAHSQPSVLLVDEVLAVGDETFQLKCLAKVAELQKAGCAVMMVTHDLEMCVDHCQRVGLLDRGKLLHIGKPTEALELYRQRRTLDAEVDAAGAHQHDVQPHR